MKCPDLDKNVMFSTLYPIGGVVRQSSNKRKVFAMNCMKFPDVHRCAFLLLRVKMMIKGI